MGGQYLSSMRYLRGIDGDLRDVMSLFDGISCGQQALKTTKRN